MGVPIPPPRLPKICHTYSTMMKLGTVVPYLKKIQKIYKSCDTPHEFCWYVRKSPEISNFSCIKKYRYRLHFNAYVLFLLTFLSLVLIQIVAILMMSAILATLEFLKIKVFWNKGYEVIIFVHDATNKILSRDSSYLVDVVMWPKFGNSSIPMILEKVESIWPKKIIFLKGALGSTSIIWDWH